jgi:hypothetical protein
LLGGSAIVPLVVPSKPTGQVFWPRIIRTMFNTEPLADVAPDRVESFFHKEAMTHVRFQLFPSPAYSKVSSPEAFRAHLRQTVGARFQWCRENRFRVVGLMDETFMFKEAREWQWNCPWAGEAARDAASFARESGLVDCVEMVDESKSPREYKAENFIRWWREGGGPPIAWPNVAPQAWETDELSDYASRYAQFWKEGSPPPALPLKEQARMIATAAHGVRRDRPFMGLVWGCGPATRHGRRVNRGVKAQHILAQIVLWIMHGAGGVQVYGYDAPRWREIRAQAPDNVLLQTGTRPGDERWSGLAAGFRFIERFEESFLGRHYAPVKVGPFWRGRREDLELAVNVSDFVQPSPFGRGKVEPGGVRYLET